MNPEHALIIARTLSHVALALGLLGLTMFALLVAQDHRSIGRDIDETEGGK